MGEEFHIEVLNRGEWRPYSSTPFSTLDDAAHECLTIMPHLRRVAEGTQITKVTTKADGSATREPVYNKVWAGAAKAPKPVNLHPKGERRPHGEAPFWSKDVLVKTAGAIVGTAAVAAVIWYFSHTSPSGGEVSVASPLHKPLPHADAPPSARQSYIYHSASGAPPRDDKYDQQLAALQRGGGMEAFFQKSPTLESQAEDVVSVLDSLDYLGCMLRGTTKERLIDTFVKYVNRTGAPAAEKDKATLLIDAQTGRTTPEFKERDQPLHEIGCGGLFAVADVYVVWFQTHR